VFRIRLAEMNVLLGYDAS